MSRLTRSIAALAMASLLLAACGENKEAKVVSGYQLDPPPQVGALSLPDASAENADVAFTAADGEFLVVYFGYTQCPDVCPTTLNEVKKALKAIGDDAEKVDVGMITIDPDRDDGELLTNYVQSFVPGAHAWRTDDDALLEQVATTFGASYSVTTNAEGAIEVSHSGNLYVVDPAGTVVLQWPFGLQADAIATDLEILLGS
ncbi:MAG: SCO family protein [Actinobacteria bacterium]|nr:SCO family protein [Actinomycetota bacterium]